MNQECNSYFVIVFVQATYYKLFSDKNGKNAANNVSYIQYKNVYFIDK